MDDTIAGEPRLPVPDLTPGVDAAPLESHLPRHPRHPLAVAGIVENGLVRPIDPAIKLPERSRVIIVASAGR
jgi:hypothetical protein